MVSIPAMDRAETMTRLREIEARIAGVSGANDSEAIARIKQRLALARKTEPDAVVRREVPNEVLADLFFLLCSRYGIEGDLVSKRALKTMQLVAPRSFVQEVFDPIFGEAARVLFEHIVDYVHTMVSEAYRMKSAGPAIVIMPPTR